MQPSKPTWCREDEKSGLPVAHPGFLSKVNFEAVFFAL